MSVGGGILQETRCFDCLAELYGMLNEDDVLFGLWKRRGAANETRAALSCIQHGMLVRGQTSWRRPSTRARRAPTLRCAADKPSHLAKDSL